jgi:hypothetical protein
MTEWQYLHPPGVELTEIEWRPVFTTREGGRIATDAPLANLWRQAAGRSVRSFGNLNGGEATMRAGVASLAEARLLDRVPAATPTRTGPPSLGSASGPEGVVSIVIVTFQSDSWLDACIASLRGQTYRATETIIVDNASPRDPSAMIAERFPEVRYHRLAAPHSFAAALNRGVELASGDYLLLLNPDVVLDPEAVGALVSRARSDSRCAAVAAKLRFLWAPAFLNGIGNRVEDRNWGADNFIGHLDLGQFDSIDQVPSACFAAALIPRTAWSAVGRVDDGFPMYYEDVEWCYRARLLGYVILSAPQARVYHAFGSQAAAATPEIGRAKLANVAYGRLRLAVKLLSGPLRRRFLRHYATEDRANTLRYLRHGDVEAAGAYARAWAKLARDVPGLLAVNRRLRRAAPSPLDEVFARQSSLPAGLVWHGLPELTFSHVRRIYLPLLAGGATRPIPEFPLS